MYTKIWLQSLKEGKVFGKLRLGWKNNIKMGIRIIREGC
jgi:hypothetical protein